MSDNINDKDRKLILDGLGQAGSDYRMSIYKNPFSGKTEPVFLNDIRRFVSLALQYIEHSIKANKRKDHLYHAYNLMTVKNDKEVFIGYLSEMLEGQVAVLSSGYLSSKEALELLDALKSSSLFRPDQYSYLLYPNKDLPGFTAKNNVPEKAVNDSELLSRLVADGNIQIIEKDLKGFIILMAISKMPMTSGKPSISLGKPITILLLKKTEKKRFKSLKRSLTTKPLPGVQVPFLVMKAWGPSIGTWCPNYSWPFRSVA